MTRSIAIGFLVLFLFLSVPAFVHAQADTNRFTHGFQRVLLAPFQLPVQTFEGAVYGPPLLGIVGGVLTGTVRTLTDLVGGVFEMAGAAAPLAKYGLFFL
ncbi:MAG: hypothetical protein A3G87_10105 [Omnitrophica bacterium RIFCSPLOWO2_12_FULL_50_11]|nr:MAG: hypothetical protein A3G87_10105 [Omnitrophica bacterium RIFCSPLOWO2_12_FULL_50_11]